MNKHIARPSGYEDDYFAWTQEQARLLRSRRLREADFDNIAEELEGLGRSERRALQSSLKLIIMQMLKLRHQPAKATQSWFNTIYRERSNIVDALDDMPSLRPLLPALFDKAYASARLLAIQETRLQSSDFKLEREFTLDQVLASDITPDPGQGDGTSFSEKA